MNNIYLTGFMCSGKTVVSKHLSKLLNKKHIDTDDFIELNLDMKINDIFDLYGEEYFRIIESAALKRISTEAGIIVSTGGGIVLKKENRELMKKTGKIIALMPEFSVIESRIKKGSSTRPLLRDDISKIRQRYETRQEFYMDCDFCIHIDKNKTVDDIANEIKAYICEEK